MINKLTPEEKSFKINPLNIYTMKKQEIYDTIFGYHTPEKSLKTAQIIEKRTPLEVVDCSWHNDTCDSVMFSGYRIQVYFPNSSENDLDQEKFNTFYMNYDYRECSEDGKSFDTLDDLIYWMENNLDDFRLPEEDQF